MRLLFHLQILLSLFSNTSCKLVREILTLTWEEGEPNGQTRYMVKMNGQFPGPRFYWNEGDDIEVCEAISSFGIPPNISLTSYLYSYEQVLVHNVMPYNTSIHWHGIEYAAIHLQCE